MNILVTTASLAWAALVNRSSIFDSSMASLNGNQVDPFLREPSDEIIWTRTAPQRNLHFAVIGDEYRLKDRDNSRKLPEDATVLEDVVVMCSSFDAVQKPNRSLAQATAAQYIAIGRDMNKWTFDLGSSPCIVTDLSKNRIFAIADAVGSMPLWYGFRDVDDDVSFEDSTVSPRPFDFFMSTDPMFDLTFANELSSVPPGFIMGFDLSKHTLYFATHWSSLASHAESDPSKVEPFSPRSYGYELLLSLHREVQRSDHPEASVLLELDNARVASKLLLCELDAIGRPFGLRETRPRVYDRTPYLPYEKWIEEFTSRIPPALLDSELYEDFGGKTTVRRLVFDRFELCSSAVEYARLVRCRDQSNCTSQSSTLPPRIISHLDGRTAQPYAAWLLGYICAKLGVDVVYPFASKSMQNIIYRFPILKVSAMEQAVPVVLEDDFTCKLRGWNKLELFNDVRTLTLPLPKACEGSVPLYLDRIYDNRLYVDGTDRLTSAETQCMYPSCAVEALRSNELDLKCMGGGFQTSKIVEDKYYFGNKLHQTLHGHGGRSTEKELISTESINPSSIAKASFLSCLCNATELQTFRRYQVFPSQPTAVGRLMRLVSDIDLKKSNDVLLVLATDGYADMLENFLCSVQATNHINSFGKNHVIIVGRRADRAVSAIADSFGALFFSEPIVPDYHGCNNILDGAFEFGLPCYQQQVLSRTKLALYLLWLGYAPLIADIDAIWTRNAFEEIHSSVGTPSFQYLNTPKEEVESRAFKTDLVTVLDGNEICGCFVYLRPSHRTIAFWNKVVDLHSGLVAETLISGKSARDFFDSEQKVLTKLILNREYSSPLVVKILNARSFPSGYDYFNLNCCRPNETDPGAVVIHNNYIIGIDAKRARFQRHGLWFALNDAKVCENRRGDLLWTSMFQRAILNASIPTINIIAPVHNSKAFSSEFLFSAGKESYNDEAQLQSLMHFSSDPPQHVPTGAFMMATALLPGEAPVVQCFGMASKSHENYAYADVAAFKSNFAVDRKNKFHDIADVQAEVFRSEALYDYSCRMGASCALSDPDQAPSLAIRVITYNRPESLRRLLDSLARSNFLGDKVDIEILVDGPKHHNGMEGYNQELFLRNLTEAIAIGFKWEYGTKKITVRKRNIGVWGQWMLAWKPQSISEVAIVLEDDMEVSPLFYLYVKAALGRYSGKSVRSSVEGPDNVEFDMHTAHLDLLNAVRMDNYLSRNGGRIESVKWNTTSDEDKFIRDESLIFSYGGTFVRNFDVNLSPLEIFAKKYAGLPVINSIALNAQYLDPLRPGRPLGVKNARSPYLYSLLSSWGPVMLPLPWRAFLEWWRPRLPGRALSWLAENLSRVESFGAFEFTDKEFQVMLEANKVDNLVTNYFWNKNHNIWTPWMVRFAFETGTKTFYPNFRDTDEGTKALVVNHRERGENYEASSGVSEVLAASIEDVLEMVVSRNIVRKTMPSRSRISDFCETERTFVDKLSAIITELEASSMSTYPYCTNMCDSLSSNAVIASTLIQCISSKLPPPQSLAWWQFDFALRRPGAIGEPDGFMQNVHEAILNGTETGSRGDACHICMSNMHWNHVFRTMKAHISRHSTILTLGWQVPMGSLMSGFQPSLKQGKPFFFDIGALVINGAAAPSVLRILPDMKRALPSSLDYWSKHSDVVVIRSCDFQSRSLMRSVLDASIRLRYLLILTEEGCNSAPTSVQILAKTFASVESVCRLGSGKDSGAVLYRLMSPDSAKKPLHISSTIRRFAGDISLREYKVFDGNDT